MSVLDVLAGVVGLERVPAAAKAREVESPYTWPMWAEGDPQWTEATLAGYAAEGYHGNAIIYSCIARKAETAAVAPLRAYTGQHDEPKMLPDAHPLARLVRRPNRYMSWYELQELLLTYLELDGNAYLVKVRRTPRGPVEALFPLRPDCVRPVARGGELLGYVYETDGGKTPYLPEEMIDVKYPNPLDVLEGLGRGRSPLMAAAYVGDVDNATTKFLKQFFDNAVVPFGLLKSKQKLVDSEVARIRARIRAQYAGMSHWGDVMILDADAEYQRLGLSMQELGFEHLDARNEARICSVLKVPPILVGAKVGLDRSTFANYGEARTSFWEDTIGPLYLRFENQLNLQLAEPDFQDAWLRYDFSNVPALRKDQTATWETAVRAFLGGVATRNEARRLAGLPPTDAAQDGFRAAEEQQIGVPAITQTPASVARSGPSGGLRTDRSQQEQGEGEDEEEGGGKAGSPFGWGGGAIHNGDYSTGSGLAVGPGLSVLGRTDSPSDEDGDNAERVELERRAARRIGAALGEQWAAIRPESDEDVALMETRLADASKGLRDAVYQALRPAALLGVTAARRAVGLDGLDTAAAAYSTSGGAAAAYSTSGGEGKPGGIGIDWTLVATYVLEWLDSYSFELIRDLDQTTRDTLRGAIQRWAQNGLPLADLIDELVTLGIWSRERAELIASTEITRAYAQGQIRAWQQTGVVRSMRWNTANDERVCPVCGPLGGLEWSEGETVPGSIDQQLADGVVTELGSPFVHPGGGGRAGRFEGRTYEAPPAHPRCRCWVTAVV